MMEKVLEQLVLLYVSKGVSNMFEVTVFEQISRRMPTTSSSEIRELIRDIKQQNSKFLVELSNPKGVILKMDKTKYQLAKDEAKKPEARLEAIPE